MREVVLDSKEDRSQVYLPDKCIGCGTCVQACSKGALVIGSVGAVARGLIDKDFLEKRKGECVFCSMCARICPTGALEFRTAGKSGDGRLLPACGHEAHCRKREMRSLWPVCRGLPQRLHRDKRSRSCGRRLP